ncbi:MAG TPA: GNAT family N-acetyltransferase [Longimicrobium sp.]|nr:GNAT family N-acetyltransferase [Longimicrobium sp.]
MSIELNDPPATAGRAGRGFPRAGAIAVELAETDEQILATREVMLQLRPHLAPDEYVARVRRLMETERFHLLAGVEDGVVRAVAGFRFMDLLYCGRILYVDDLVTDEAARSAGWGARLLEWMRWRAEAEECAELHLDSRVTRARAHRFYFRQGMEITAFHFALPL